MQGSPASDEGLNESKSVRRTSSPAAGQSKTDTPYKYGAAAAASAQAPAEVQGEQSKEKGPSAPSHKDESLQALFHRGKQIMNKREDKDEGGNRTV